MSLLTPSSGLEQDIFAAQASAGKLTLDECRREQCQRAYCFVEIDHGGIRTEDVANISDGELRNELAAIGKAESKLSARKAKVLAELARRHTTAGAKRVARDVLRTSNRAAHHHVKSAEHLEALAVTSDALSSGTIPTDHALLIARASSEGPIAEAELVQAAKTQTYDELVKTVKKQQHELSNDDGQAIYDKKRKRRLARLFQNPDTGMYVLNAEFDPITGSHIAGTLASKEREFWKQENTTTSRTHVQRACDALAELILHPEKGKASGIALVLVADYDATHAALLNSRISDGTPLPIRELLKRACEAKILPALYNTKTQELWLGRTRRTASEAQRIALMIRDQQCVGCGADANRSFAHHVQFWQHNGKTDYSNLVLVCNDCHHQIHDNGFEVIQNPATGRWTTQPPPDPFPTLAKQPQPLPALTPY